MRLCATRSLALAGGSTASSTAAASPLAGWATMAWSMSKRLSVGLSITTFGVITPPGLWVAVVNPAAGREHTAGQEEEMELAP